MSQLARQIANQYFGFVGDRLAVGATGNIGAEVSNITQQLAATIGEWEPTEENIIRFSQAAGDLETKTVIAQKYSKQIARFNAALSKYNGVVSNHLVNSSRQSLQLAQQQERMVAQMIPIALDMGATAASTGGRLNAVGSSRLRALGAR